MRKLLGYSALEIYDMSMEERFLLYENAELGYTVSIDGIWPPTWTLCQKAWKRCHFYCGRSQRYMRPEGRAASEREIVASSVMKPWR